MNKKFGKYCNQCHPDESRDPVLDSGFRRNDVIKFMDGILVIDKPSGPTSHDICQYFKRQLGVKKVGHAGTLDPLATGVLILLIDGATKHQALFMGKEKEYEFTFVLGAATDTYDCEGKIIQEGPVPTDALGQIKNMLPEFRGEILQTPPAYSAIKKNGKPLYKLAREGKEVKPEPRKITIHSLEIIFSKISPSPHPLPSREGSNTTGYLLPYGSEGKVVFPPPLEGGGGGRGPNVTLRCRCSSGTYVRSIAHDIGQKLGCGAHITALRRLRSEPFGVEDALKID